MRVSGHVVRIGGSIWLGVALGVVTSVSSASAQGGLTYDSGSDESDGALAIAPDQGPIDFDPSTFSPPLDPDGDGVYHFTTITIGANTTLRLSASILGQGKPVIWLATGAVQISGILDLNGRTGHHGSARRELTEAGAGGWAGGEGGNDFQPPQPGLGPGGGRTARHSQAGGAGHRNAGGAAGGGASYGNSFLLPLNGGSGGGGGWESGTDHSGGGGGGGGAILIASSTSLDLSGSITARGGGPGGSTRTRYASVGGGGSGGAVRLIAPITTGRGSVYVDGSHYSSPGWIRVEAFEHHFFGANLGYTTYTRPGSSVYTDNSPRIQVTDIGGVAITQVSTGDFWAPDATLNTSDPVTLTLQAANIPPGTSVSLVLSNDQGTRVDLPAVTLQGTLASSTAITEELVLPFGFSRFHLTATFTPQ